MSIYRQRTHRQNISFHIEFVVAGMNFFPFVTYKLLRSGGRPMSSDATQCYLFLFKSQLLLCFLVYNLILSKLYMNANFIKAQIFMK